jgi:HEAT repeat protein
MAVMRRVDATQRLRAVHGTRSPDELVRSLDDPSPEVVRAAIARLVDLEGQWAAGPLRARLFDVDLSLVADLAGALRRIGDGGAVEVAMEALRDGRYSRRLAAVRALGALGDPRAGECLRTMLDDDVGGVRGAALDALARLGPRVDGDGADCARLLADPAPHVRIAAVRSVARLVRHPGAMLAPAVKDKDRLVRLEVARHAAGLPERAANTLLGDPDLRVREAAARGAGVRELGALAVLLTDDPARDVRRASAHTLGAMRGERVADVLVPGVEDPDALVRAAVLHALETLLTRETAVGRLCDELTSERPERRRASVYALAHLNAREAAPALSRLADDPDPDVRLALVHSAEALFPGPEPLMRYLAADAGPAVRQGAEMWLLRAAGRRS